MVPQGLYAVFVSTAVSNQLRAILNVHVQRRRYLRSFCLVHQEAGAVEAGLAGIQSGRQRRI
jgi:hypothetical protein